MESNNTITLTEYSFTGVSGTVYHPSVVDGKWRLMFMSPFNTIAILCNIPADEAVILKLKYGG